MLDDPPAKLVLVGMHRENIVLNKERQHILFKHTWSIPKIVHVLMKEITNPKVYTTSSTFTDPTAIQSEISNKNIFRKSTSVNLETKHTSKYWLKKEVKMKNSKDSGKNKTKSSNYKR